MNRIILWLVLALLFFGCTTASKISKVRLGMSRAEVIGVLGTPVSATATQDAEFLNYRLSETRGDAVAGTGTPYYVKFVNGKVEAFGRAEELE